VAAVAERVGGYMIKAVREGKEESSWSNPNAAYEAALTGFVAAALDASRPNAFLADFHAFIGSIARRAAIASLAQQAIKLTAPGVPDLYQGCELWDFSLVDPDNRRPPDWDHRRELLTALADTAPSSLSAGWEDGREKQFLVARLLRLRQQFPALFDAGSYLPLYGEGSRAEHHLCAFARSHAETTVVTAAPRLVYRLDHDSEPGWGDSVLALPQAARWRDVLTGRLYNGCARVPVAELFGGFPVAVLLGDLAQ
jgi:(1->4)-alpha-D-glucan 1-alpha-D-glucosylmutase